MNHDAYRHSEYTRVPYMEVGTVIGFSLGMNLIFSFSAVSAKKP